MAVYEVSLNSEQLSGLLTSDRGLQGLVETVLNQVLEAQVSDQIGALPYERSEQALVLAMMEMVLKGVSTRKVANVTEELCGTRFSRSTSGLIVSGVNETGYRELPGLRLGDSESEGI